MITDTYYCKAPYKRSYNFAPLTKTTLFFINLCWLVKNNELFTLRLINAAYLTGLCNCRGFRQFYRVWQQPRVPSKNVLTGVTNGSRCAHTLQVAEASGIAGEWILPTDMIRVHLIVIAFCQWLNQNRGVVFSFRERKKDTRILEARVRT